MQKIYISQGEMHATKDPTTVISTLLGSCVSACIWDPIQAVGGMNHVLFVDDTLNAARAYGHGVNAMELLINGLLKLGGQKDQMKAKVSGGAKMIQGRSSAGQKNGDFVNEFLASEGIACVSHHLGGCEARRVEFFPATGRARMKLVRQDVPIEKTSEVQSSTDFDLF